MAQKKGKQKKVTESVLKHLEEKMDKRTVENPHFRSFITALVQSDINTTK